MEKLQVPSFVNERSFNVQKQNSYLEIRENRIVKIKKRREALRKIKIAVGGTILGTAVICSTLFLSKSKEKEEPKPVILTVEQHEEIRKLNEVKEKIKDFFGKNKEEIINDEEKVVFIESGLPAQSIEQEMEPVKANKTKPKSRDNVKEIAIKSDIEEIEVEYKDTNVSSNYDIVKKFMNDDLKSKFDNASEVYGCNSDLLVALSTQETTLGHGSFSKTAKGIMQIENVNCGNVYNQYNFRTNEMEKVSFSKLNLDSNNDNIKAGSIMLQDVLKNYDYNVLFALQAYNFGPGLVDKAISMAEEELGKSKYELTYDDVHPYFKYIHNNPSKFVRNWGRGTYGDGNYSDNVRQYLNERILSTKIVKNDLIYNNIYDFETGKCIKQYTTDNTRPGLYYDKENKIYLTDDDISDVVTQLNERLKSNNKKY